MCAQLKMKEESKSNTLNLEKYPHIQGSELFKILKCLPRLGRGGPWVAGGSVWRTVNNEMLKDCDIDIYFPNAISYEQSYRQMNSYPFVNNVLSEKKTKWNTTFQIHINEGKYDKTIDVQFIGMSYYSKLEKLLNSFDFPVCQFGYDGKDIFTGSKSLTDLEKRQISIHKINYPKSSFKHILKYLNNGFVIPPDELKRLVKYMLEMDCWSKNASGKYDSDENFGEDVLTNNEMPIPTNAVWEDVTLTPTRRNVVYNNVGYGHEYVNTGITNTAPRLDTNFSTAVDMNNPNLGYGYVNTGGPNTVPQTDQNTMVVQDVMGRPMVVDRVVYDTMFDNPLQAETPIVEDERNNTAANRILQRLREMGGVEHHNLHGMEAVREHRIENVIINNNTTPVILEEDPWEGYRYHPRPRN